MLVGPIDVATSSSLLACPCLAAWTADAARRCRATAIASDGHGGIALANTASGFTQALALSWFLRRHTGPLKDSVTGPSIARSAIATVVMGVVVVWLSNQLFVAGTTGGALLLPYSIIVGSAVVTYTGVAFAIRHPELTEVLGIVRRRIQR